MRQERMTGLAILSTEQGTISSLSSRKLNFK